LNLSNLCVSRQHFKKSAKEYGQHDNVGYEHDFCKGNSFYPTIDLMLSKTFKAVIKDVLMQKLRNLSDFDLTDFIT
tara:strand:- start:21287 stop:21514 length:228 start_codon:yes stop_codon:yes gene_type:complete